MAGETSERPIGARGYAVQHGVALPDYDKPLPDSQEFRDRMTEQGPWILTEWDGTRWAHVRTVTERSELDEWLAGVAGGA